MSTSYSAVTSVSPDSARQRSGKSRIENERPASESESDVEAAEEEAATTEELLIEHLDKFLSSVESRLDSFEQYFKLASKGEVEEKLSQHQQSSQSLSPLSILSSSRRNSSASINSITNYSIGNLKSMYQRMGMIKGTVLKSSVSNLEHLYANLEEHYQYFTKRDNEGIEEDNKSFTQPDDEDSDGSLSADSVRQKILTTLEYFEGKFTQVDNLIQSRTPKAKDDYKSSTFRHFKYFNFNKAIKAAEDRNLHYYELPLNWRENRYIIQGYRFSLKHTTMLKSIFQFNHNESANIWTHMLGAFLILYLMFYHFPSSQAYALNSFRDNIAMYFFLFAALECMVSSVVWHTYSCFAHYKTRSTCACVDYTGITVLITASVIVAEYCSLYSYPKILKTYIGFSILCGAAGFGFNWSPYFDRPECKSLRIGFFMSLAFLGASTFVVHCFYEGFVPSFKFFSPLIYKSFLWYWIGVVFYGGLIPERWRYDVIINEDESSCKHNRSVSEVIEGNVEHSGLEEMDEIEKELEPKLSANNEQVEEEKQNEDTYQSIIDKHFPAQPTVTPYHKDFLSLYWVDYIFASHNLWHVCVVLGVWGHYVCVLDMYEQLMR